MSDNNMPVGKIEQLTTSPVGGLSASNAVVISDAALDQFKRLQKTIHQQNKAIRRKNKYINRLEEELDMLRAECADIGMMYSKAIKGTKPESL